VLLETLLTDRNLEPSILPPQLYITLGLVYEGESRWAEAKGAFERAVEVVRAMFPAGGHVFLEDILSHQAGIQYQLGNVEVAVSILEGQLRTLYPVESNGWHRIHNYLAAVYTAMERHAEARDSYERVLASPSATEEHREAARKGLAELAAQREDVQS
jgi:tetratricopeptide (TPR) repeat protein